MTLKTAVIGVGHLGKQHARIHATLAAEGLTRVRSSVCDLDEKPHRESRERTERRMDQQIGAN